MELIRLPKINNYSKLTMSELLNTLLSVFFQVLHVYQLEALILQFKRLANVYFLIIAILQTIPQISPLSPATAWAPFIVVLAISMLR